MKNYNRFKRCIREWICLGLFCSIATDVFASLATSNIQVTANISGTCTVAATNLAFGNYTGATLDGVSTISVKCTNGLGYKIALSAGTGTGATTAQRVMMFGIETLNYNLYKDSQRSIAWGDNGDGTVSDSGTGQQQDFTVYGRIPDNQNSPVGNYTDTIAVTVSFNT